MAAHLRWSIKSYKLACSLAAVCISLLISGVFSFSPVKASTAVRVTVNGQSAAGCGDSWANACSLVYALANAPDHSQLWVKAGTYLVPAQNSPFTIRSGLAVYGGFSGLEEAMEDRNWRKNTTILSGDLNQDDGSDGSRRAENSFHVVVLNRSSASTRLDGFIIQAGNATGSDTNAQGGGVRIYHGDPVLENLTFRHNTATQGGAVYSTGQGSPTLLNIVFESNHAEDGGGLYVDNQSTPLLEGAAFQINQASRGGGISNYGRLTVNNLSMSGNTAQVRGGAIYNGRAYVILTNSILWGNHQGQASNQLSNSGTSIFASNNIIEGGYDQGGSNFNLDPRFVENPTSGNDQSWGTADDTPGSLELRYESPAIDRGVNLFLDMYNLLSFDLNHWPRFIDHPRPDTTAGQIVDLGAYEAGIIYVRQGALEGGVPKSGNGSSWGQAYPELRTALAEEGHAGNEFWVARGTYTPDPGRESSFHLVTDLALYGGFAGSETARAQRNWQANLTTLSGDLGLKTDPADNAYHVVSAQETGVTAILDGFTIQDGNANGESSPETYGGGLYLDHASPTLAHLIITANQARNGGGLYASSSEYRLTESRLTRNQAVYGGGVFQTGPGMPHLANLIFTGNRASDYGGAMFNNASASPDLSNAIFAGNQSEMSGGIFNNGESQPMLRNITMVENQGGAVYTFASSQAININLVNVILWHNGFQPVMTFRGSLNFNRGILEYNCPSSAACNYILSTDPRFHRLPSAGKDEVWGTEDDDYGDLRLMPNSPAIDAGDNNLVLSTEIVTDLAGNPRFTDVLAAADTGVGEPPLVDMGAYEAKYSNTTVRIVSVDPAPSVVGQAAVITFQVTSEGNNGIPSGLVTIKSKDASCSAPAGEGACSLVFQHSGVIALTAYFAGDEVFDASFSDGFTHQVIPATTQILLTLPGGPVKAGQLVHASFTVTSLAPGAGQPSGTVQVGAPPYGCTALISEGGEAGCDLVFTAPGSYSIIAQYQGSQDYLHSQSSAVDIQVSPAATQTQILSVSSDPSAIGEPVIVTFEVTAPVGVAEAEVTVSNGDAACSAPATDGQCTLTFNKIGATVLTARYNDGVMLESSESAPVQHTVNPAKTTIQLSLAALETAESSQLIHAAFDLQIQPPGTGSPTGIVEISDGETTCQVEISTATAAAQGCDLRLNGTGIHQLTAYYRGSVQFLACTSDPVSFLVGKKIYLPVMSK